MFSSKIIHAGHSSTVVAISGGKVRKDISTDYSRHPLCLELELLQTMDHPHLVKAESISVHHDRVSIVMDRADGDLVDLLSKGSLPMVTRLDLMHQVCLGLVELHRHGIAHLDIKPDNILIWNQGKSYTARLSDYGLSYDTTIGFPISPSGTFQYSPPEVMETILTGGVAPPSLRSDVWSFGLVMYVIMTEDYSYLNLERPYHQVLASTNRVWIDPTRRDRVLDRIEHPIIRSIISRMLCPASTRYSIAQVADAMAMVSTRCVETVESMPVVTPIPIWMNEYIRMWLNRVMVSPFRIGISAEVHDLPIEIGVRHWLHRLLPRLPPWEISTLDELNTSTSRLAILIYIILTYLGYQRSIQTYGEIIGLSVDPSKIRRWVLGSIYDIHSQTPSLPSLSWLIKLFQVESPNQ